MLLAWVLLVVSAAATLWVGTTARPGSGDAGDTVPPSSTVSVDQRSLVCPGGFPGAARDRVAVVSIGQRRGGDAKGTVTAAPVGRSASAGDLDLAGGRLRWVPERSADSKSSVRPLTIDAHGPPARGLVGFRVSVGKKTVAVSPCADAAGESWFTGVGGSAGHTSRLQLVNIGAGPATVDLSIYGPQGAVDTVGTRGITLRPGETRRVAVPEVAPSSEDLLLHVSTQRGRVVASVADSFVPRPGQSGGRAWIPPQSRPRRSVLLSGIPPRPDRAEVVVGNPGADDALVDVRVVGRQGTFTPTGPGKVRVPPGSVASVDVTDALDRGPVSVRLDASAPVTAALRSVSGSDSSYAANVSAPTRSALAVSAVPVPATVVLSSPGTGGKATVTGYNRSGGRVSTDRLRVGARSTATADVAKDAAYVRVRADAGVHGAVSLHGAARVDAVALRSLVTRTRRPGVVEVLPLLR